MTRSTHNNDHGAKREHAPFAFEDSVILATNVERLMAEQNYGKTKFTAVASITRPTLNKILSGDGDIKLSSIRKVAGALGVRVGDLFAIPQDNDSPRTRL